MLGGISWGEVSDVLMDIDVCPGLSGSMDFAFAIQLRRQRISPALLLLYVAFTMLAAPGLPICHTLARTLASTAQAERTFYISRQTSSACKCSQNKNDAYLRLATADRFPEDFSYKHLL